MLRHQIFATFALVLAVIAVSFALKPSLPENEVTIAIQQPQEIDLVVTPLALECRTRVTGQAQFSILREHNLGIRYRTDRLGVDMVGDIDICVDADLEFDEGVVTVPSEAIHFVRPRVNHENTELTYDKGNIGKITDVSPWASEDSGMEEVALLYGQNLILTQCTDIMYGIAQSHIKEAYSEAYGIEVIVEKPSLPSHEPIHAPDMSVNESFAISCNVASDDLS